MQRTAILLVVALALGGCSLMEDKKIDYQSAGTSVPSLEVPPDLIMPSGDNRFTVPDTSPKGSATYSAYSKDRAAKPVANAKLLPQVDKVRIERAGTQRWMVVDQTPQQVWPVIKDFWQELGFLINVEQPDAGVMETDWAENRAKIPQDMLRNVLGKLIDSVYSTAERDKFRTRLEPSADGRSTEVFISHRGMYEVYEGTQGGSDEGKGRTVWQPRPADPELEAEMLRRLMVRFGVEEQRAQSMIAQAVSEPRAKLDKSADGAPLLSLPETYDRAWRRVGLALDRVGFAVEDRDRAAGVYYVRYADPEAGSKKKEGILSKLVFWESDDSKIQALRYRVKLSAAGEDTLVTVLQDDGTPARNETGNRIATLLHEQLK